MTNDSHLIPTTSLEIPQQHSDDFNNIDLVDIEVTKLDKIQLDVNFFSIKTSIIPTSKNVASVDIAGEVHDLPYDMRPEIDFTQIENTLKITIGIRGNSSNRRIGKVDVIVSIPKTFNKNLIVSSTCNSVEVRNFKLQDLKVSLATGKIAVYEVISENLSIINECGKIDIERVISEKAIISNSTGLIKCLHCNFKKTSIENSAGSIKVIESIISTIFVKDNAGKIVLEEASGKMKVINYTGAVVITVKELTDTIDVENKTGQVKLYLPEDALFDYDLETFTGTMKCEFEHVNCKKGFLGSTARRIDGDKPLIKASTACGSIKLLKK